MGSAEPHMGSAKPPLVSAEPHIVLGYKCSPLENRSYTTPLYANLSHLLYSVSLSGAQVSGTKFKLFDNLILLCAPPPRARARGSSLFGQPIGSLWGRSGVDWGCDLWTIWVALGSNWGRIGIWVESVRSRVDLGCVQGGTIDLFTLDPIVS